MSSPSFSQAKELLSTLVTSHVQYPWLCPLLTLPPVAAGVTGGRDGAFARQQQQQQRSPITTMGIIAMSPYSYPPDPEMLFQGEGDDEGGGEIDSGIGGKIDGGVGESGSEHGVGGGDGGEIDGGVGESGSEHGVGGGDGGSGGGEGGKGGEGSGGGEG